MLNYEICGKHPAATELCVTLESGLPPPALPTDSRLQAEFVVVRRPHRTEVMRLIAPRSVIDLGCGDGEWLAEFQKHGVADFLGVESEEMDRSALMIPQPLFRPHDLRTPFFLDRTFDLAMSLEVAEHLPPHRAEDFVAELTALAPVVLFSVAIPNEGGIQGLGEVALLDAPSGRLLWKRAFPLPDDGLLSSNWAGGPVFLGDVVVVSSGDGNIRGFDLETGDIRWTIPKLDGQLLFPIAADHDFRALAVDGDLLVSSSSTGVVVAYDATTREERWRYVGTGLGSAAFRISAENGRVYVPFLNGLLVSLDSASGQERWRLGTYASAFLWPPASGGDRLFVTGGGDGLVAVEDPR